jgi:DNA-nicking Smr family endonuclease
MPASVFALADELWEEPLELPGEPQPYALANPWIRSDRENAVASLRELAPGLSDATLALVLEEYDWRPERAAQEICVLATQLERGSHPLRSELQQRFPGDPPDLALLALEQADFDLETAALSLEIPALRELLLRDFAVRAAPTRQRAIDALAAKRREFRSGRPKLGVHSECVRTPDAVDGAQSRPRARDWPGRRARPVKTVDLHGCTRSNVADEIAAALEEARADESIQKVNFITGKGRHSLNETPLLRPLVLELLDAWGYEAELMEKNQGIVQAFIRGRQKAPDPAPEPLAADFSQRAAQPAIIAWPPIVERSRPAPIEIERGPDRS